MAEYLVSDISLTSVADAIREKTGGTAQLNFPDGFITAITSISSDNSDNTSIASSIQSGSITLTADSALLNITHNFGSLNKINWAIVAKSDMTPLDYFASVCCILLVRDVSVSDNWLACFIRLNAGIAAPYWDREIASMSIRKTTAIEGGSNYAYIDDSKIALMTTSTSLMFHSGDTYRWWIGGDA